MSKQPSLSCVQEMQHTQPVALRFYNKDQVAVEKVDARALRLLRAEAQWLGFSTGKANSVCSLIQVDMMGSVLGIKRGTHQAALAYSPYGWERGRGVEGGLLRFVGQAYDVHTEGYGLGNGRRVYKSGLMRFMSPDALSPFGRGGCNAYAYCNGDPVNATDPSGAFPKFLRRLMGASSKSDFPYRLPKYKKLTLKHLGSDDFKQYRVVGFDYDPGRGISREFRARVQERTKAFPKGLAIRPNLTDPKWSQSTTYYVDRKQKLFIAEHLINEGKTSGPVRLPQGFVDDLRREKFKIVRFNGTPSDEKKFDLEEIPESQQSSREIQSEAISIRR
jgi:RHS repeat-associated protein